MAVIGMTYAVRYGLGLRLRRFHGTEARCTTFVTRIDCERLMTQSFVNHHHVSNVSLGF